MKTTIKTRSAIMLVACLGLFSVGINSAFGQGLFPAKWSAPIIVGNPSLHDCYGVFSPYVTMWLSGRFFDCFTGFTGMLLNPAQQFLGLAFDALEFVVRKLGQFLFQLALDDVKVTFDFEFCHKISRF
jgi:hypothetical protein